MLPILRTSLVNIVPKTPGLPSLNETFGATLIGSYIGFIIYGLNLYQMFHYFKAFRNDHLYLKILVVLETWHTALCMHTCYHYLVTNYFNPLALSEGCGLTIITCQTFFVRRVYLLVGWRWRILAAVVPTFAQFEPYTWIISMAFGFSAIADIILTTVLICALRKCRTGMKSTDSMLDALILYAISTGICEITHQKMDSVFDLLTFVFALIRPSKLIYFGIDIVATKLYTTSLLTALNARRMLAKQSSGAAAIYGESGLTSGSTERKRSAFAVNRLVSPRDTTDHESSRGEAIEMNVKANHVYNGTGDVGPQAPIISIGPLGSSMGRSQSESA
ncbi:hypothetical protein PYCCODRAFT_1436748 [Trametes coccinea BRFM310]|uniref:DUF6534 domain-containing protein n=1 Tax=Trametes coccinea (strain BRFM310) TaxID=1353009 RepID=A0A1Y2IIN7_TRAC3|nr:hypothetical protein PYCCODRAFT_1436748 [Trametes coccinea BRFM310]